MSTGLTRASLVLSLPRYFERDHPDGAGDVVYLEWVLTVLKEELEVFEVEMKEYSSDRPPKSMLPIVTSTSLTTPPPDPSPHSPLPHSPLQSPLP